MESGAMMKMAEDALCHICFIIAVIISNNDSTIRAVLKHPSIDARGQVMNSSKIKIDEEIPAPSFFADTLYCMKVVSKHIFSIVSGGKAQIFE